MRDFVTLNTALSDYYEQRSARYSESTWKAHELQLEAFRAWVSKASELGPNCPLRDVDERTMVRYFNRLQPPVYAPSSFNNYRNYLMMFIAHCLSEGWIDRNPMRHVDPARVIRRKRLQLSAQELLMLLDGAAPRDRVGLALGMHTGLRAGDVMNLKVGDVNLSNNTLHAFVAKTQTADDLPIDSELRDELDRWLIHYAGAMDVAYHAMPHEWTLVPPMHNVMVAGGDRATRYEPLRTYTNPETIVQRALGRLGYPTKGEGFHTLRRSTARRFYELAMNEGVKDPIRMSQALLGHKRRETTEIYLGLTVEKEMRDELLRGKPFLRAVADAEIEARGGSVASAGSPKRLEAS